MGEVQANKALVARFFDLLSAGRMDEALAMIADDCTWWIAGKAQTLPLRGNLGKPRIAKLFHFMDGALQAPLQMRIKGMIAEGSELAVEAESLGQLKNGRTYNQEYHFRFTIRAGKIAAVREYLDTLHVQETWSTP